MLQKSLGRSAMAEGDEVLAQDDGWKRIQQNTFTRWCNEHLRKVDQRIDNLETDLSDGLLLIQLVQVLSHKRLPKWNKKPSFVSALLASPLSATQLWDAFTEIAETGECELGAQVPPGRGGHPHRQHRSVPAFRIRPFFR